MVLWNNIRSGKEMKLLYLIITSILICFISDFYVTWLSYNTAWEAYSIEDILQTGVIIGNVKATLLGLILIIFLPKKG